MGNFALKWEKFMHAMFDNGGYETVLLGLRNTVLVAVVGLVIGIVIGTVLAAVEVMPKYKRLPRVLDKICRLYVAFFRGTPLVVQLLVGYFVLRPLLGLPISALASCMIIYGMNSGAYVSEIMRSGIQSVDPGQMEAGRSLGMNYFTTMRFIVIPQAVKNILPALGNEFITLLKDTSLITVIGGKEMTYAAKAVIAKTYQGLFPLFGIALMYLLLVMLFSKLLSVLERRLRQSDRR